MSSSRKLGHKRMDLRRWGPTRVSPRTKSVRPCVEIPNSNITHTSVWPTTPWQQGVTKSLQSSLPVDLLNGLFERSPAVGFPSLSLTARLMMKSRSHQELLHSPWQTQMRRDGGASDLLSFVIKIETHSVQVGSASRERPADLPDWERLHISRHRAFPGSVHLP